MLKRSLLLCTLLCPAILSAADAKPDRAQPTSRSEKNLEGWKFRVDDRLLQAPHEELGAKTLRFLAAKLVEIKEVVPAERIKQLQTVTIVLDLHCGDLNSMQYHPDAGWLKAHGYPAELEKCVHLPYAAGVVTSRNIREQPWCILHELAHAYHDQFLGFEEPGVMEAYERYKKSGRGDATLLYNGKHVKHYALTNQKEFFAEMTEAYFGSNDFYPFNRAELLESEPELTALLTRIWIPAK